MPDITIPLTTNQENRLLKAYGRILNLVDGVGQPRDATLLEVRSMLINYMRNTVLDHERQEALKNYTATPY